MVNEPSAARPGVDSFTAKTAFRATVAVTVISFFSHVLGLGREASMAGMFGAGMFTDAYFVALMVPNLIGAIMQSSLPTVGISLVGEHLYRPEKQADLQKVVWSMFHLIFAFVAVLTAICIFVLPSCMHRIAPGFSPEQTAIAGRMSMVLAGIIICIGLSCWCQIILQVTRQFNIPALSNVFFNIALITAILLSGRYWNIEGVAWGMLLATAVQFLFQFPHAAKVLPQYRAVMDLHHPTVRTMAIQSFPVFLRLAVFISFTVIERFLASRLAVGSISALNYALLTFQIPVTVIGTPITTVLYSAMTTFHASGDTEKYRRAYVRGLRMIAFLFIPMTVALIIFRHDCVRILFLRGAFDETAAGLTATALAYYAIGLMFAVWINHTIQALATLQDFLSPLWTTLAAIAINIGFDILIVDHLKHGGLALGVSVRSIVWFASLFYFLRRRLGPLGAYEIARSCFQIAAAAICAGAVGWLLRDSTAVHGAWTAFDAHFCSALGVNAGRTAAALTRLLTLSTVCLVAFVAICKLFRIRETDELIELVRDYLRKRSANTPQQS